MAILDKQANRHRLRPLGRRAMYLARLVDYSIYYYYTEDGQLLGVLVVVVVVLVLAVAVLVVLAVAVVTVVVIVTAVVAIVVTVISIILK